MEIRFDIGNFSSDTVVDNIILNMQDGMKNQCVYQNQRASAYLKPINQWYPLIVNTLNEKGVNAEYIQREMTKVIVALDAGCRLEFRQENGVDNCLLNQFDAVHWATWDMTIFKYKKGKLNKRWNFYGDYYAPKDLKKFMECQNKESVVRFVYHPYDLDGENEIEGDIRVCQHCAFCGMNNCHAENANEYVFRPLEQWVERVERYPDSREEVIRSWQAFQEEAKQKGENTHMDFFGARTKVCGMRYLEGEVDKDLRETIHIDKRLCPYFTEHMVMSFNKKKP